MEFYVSLDQEDFRLLVGGDTVKKDIPTRLSVVAGETSTMSVRITLQDIGWSRIVDIVRQSIMTDTRR